MSKTDKELATEIVCAYLQARSGTDVTSIKWAELSPLIEMVYTTVHNLSERNSQNA